MIWWFTGGLVLRVVCIRVIGDLYILVFFLSSRRRHTRSLRDWSSDVCSSDLRLVEMFGRDNVKVELIDHDQPTDDERNDALYELAGRAKVQVVASSNVHYASQAQARLAQALAAIRARSSLDEMNGWLRASGRADI